VLCDTNGGTMPWEVEKIVREMKESIQHPFGIHTHNDSECAVVNALVAVREGAIQVQGTINGIGERCGNANLCSIIANLELKMGRQCLPEGGLHKLYDLSHVVAEVANVTPNDHLPYVGKSAFAHKGGVHVAAMRRSEQSYQHVAPERVGNKMRVVVSDLSGRANLLSKAEEHGVAVDGGADVVGVLNDVKELEARGFSFEAAEASVAMMLKRQQPGYKAAVRTGGFPGQRRASPGPGHFRRGHGQGEGQGGSAAHRRRGQRSRERPRHRPAQGVAGHYPEIATFQLADYKVRILDGQDGTRSHHSRVDRHPQHHPAVEHRRRQRQHHRSLLAGAGLMQLSTG
jgi:2-isopropylmalate synthase